MIRDRVIILSSRCWLVCICLSSFAFVKSSFADSNTGVYLGFAVAPQFFSDNGAGDATIDFDTGYAVGALFGYKLSKFRFAGELDYQKVEGTSSTNVNADVEIVRFTAGAYYDFNVFFLRPYIGGGMGIAGLTASGDFEDEDSSFTWHGEAGLTFNLTDRFAILPSYRYEWTDTNLGTFNGAQTAHAFRITLRYQFQPLTWSAREVQPDSRYTPTPGYYYDPYYSCDPRYNPDCRPRSYSNKHRPHVKKPGNTKTPEERERDRCGWQGPGCPPDNKNWQK